MDKVVAYSAFQAVMLFQMVYILLQYFHIRRKEYLYYLGYMLCMSLYATLKYEPQIGFTFLRHVDANAEIHFDRDLPIFSFFMYYRFARYFADIEHLIPRLNAIIKKMEVFVLCYAGFEVIWAFSRGSRWVGEYIFWAVCVVQFSSYIFFGIWLFTKRNTLINILIFGAILVNIGSLTTLVIMHLQHTGWATDFDALLPSNLGIVIELLAFTTGLAYKARMAEKKQLTTQHALLAETQKKLQLSERIHHMRSSIATDFHNDLSASLSGIGIYSSLLKKSIQENPSQAQTLAVKIADSANRLSDAVLDIIWALYPTTNSLNDVVKKLNAFAKDELEPMGCSLKIENNLADAILPLNVNGVKTIYSLVKVFARSVVNEHACKNIYCCFT
jgi:signal transduction histidine kinase